MSPPRNDRLYGKTGALNLNMTSDFKPEVVVWSKLRMRSEKLPKLSKSRVKRRNFPRHVRNRSCSIHFQWHADLRHAWNKLDRLRVHLNVILYLKSHCNILSVQSWLELSDVIFIIFKFQQLIKLIRLVCWRVSACFVTAVTVHTKRIPWHYTFKICLR